MAAETLYQYKFDSVWFVPCGDRIDKQSRSSAVHRLNMTRIAVKDFFNEKFPVEVNSIEVDNGTTIPTYFLMNKLKENYAGSLEFFFILGSDLIPTLKLWHEPEKLVKDINFVVFNRVGYDINQYLNTPDMPLKYLCSSESKYIFGEISSTEVRNRIHIARASDSGEESN